MSRCDESFVELQTVHEDNTLGQLICLTQSVYSTGITQYKYLLKSVFGVYLGVVEHILNNYSLLCPSMKCRIYSAESCSQAMDAHRVNQKCILFCYADYRRNKRYNKGQDYISDIICLNTMMTYLNIFNHTQQESARKGP